MNRAVAPPILNRLQHAWLQELGLDARMLARYALAGTVDAGVAQGSPRVPGTAGIRKKTSPSTPGSNMATEATPASTEPSPLASMRTALLAGKPLRKSSAPLQKAAVETSPEGAPSIQAKAASPMIDVSEVLDMDSLRTKISSCRSCSLHESRSHVVFGSGDVQAPRLLILGEAPGDHDDRVGEPFQGPTGELLHAMLAAVGMDPAGSVYYTNIVKCRPLGSRPARDVEMQSCNPYLARQIDLLRPGFVLALGRMAALSLLGGDETLDALRGRVHQFTDARGRSTSLVATHHPTSLLLRARSKADVWSDLNLMRKAMAGGL